MDIHQLKTKVLSWGSSVLYERRLDVRTSGKVGLEELGLADDDRLYYEPAEWRVLARIFKRREIGTDDVFIDYGAGMGRVLLLAARYGPRRVIGVELAPELTEIARENVERNKARLRCKDIEVLTADALKYNMPEDVTIVFFNNPFTGSIFAGVMDKVVESLDASPRRLRIAYRNPLEHEAVIATGRFQLVRSWEGQAWRGPRGVKINLYETTNQR